MVIRVTPDSPGEEYHHVLREPTLQTQEEMDAMNRLADEREAFLNAHWDEFKRLYPDEVIVVQDGKVIDHDADTAALMARMEARGIDNREVWMEFVQVNTIFIL